VPVQKAHAGILALLDWILSSMVSSRSIPPAWFVFIVFMCESFAPPDFPDFSTLLSTFIRRFRYGPFYK
jgi:hypothetical protein